MGINSRRRPDKTVLGEERIMFVVLPKTVKFSDMSKKLSLSAHSYKVFVHKNKNTKLLKELLLEYKIGKEVGSDSYIDSSPKYFIKNNALQPEFYTPILDNKECAVPILPQKFIEMELEKGDILMSKDANIGESAILPDNLHDYMISGGLVKLKFEPDLSLYIFAVMKHDFFKEQINLMTSKGATIKHAKKLWLNTIIPFPTQADSEDVIKYVALLTSAIIRKEEEIKKKYQTIIKMIDKELKTNQKQEEFNYKFPTFSEVLNAGRLDTGVYTKNFKKLMFDVENYKAGASTLKQLGFNVKRGPNLAVSVIGESIYTDEPRDNYYRLLEPKHISRYMTVTREEYLGNKNKIPTLRKGHILFGAEGCVGKVYVLCENIDNTITNYHGMSIYSHTHPLEKSIFIATWLSYLKEKGVLNNLAVGGQGGSVGKDKLLNLKIPNFPSEITKMIAKLYYNPVHYKTSKLNLDSFEQEDKRVTNESGIYNLDLQIKLLKRELDNIITSIALGKKIDTNFDFLKSVSKGE